MFREKDLFDYKLPTLQPSFMENVMPSGAKNKFSQITKHLKKDSKLYNSALPCNKEFGYSEPISVSYTT